jgi:two-component system, response regulator
MDLFDQIDIVLVEDDPHDIELTMHAFEQYKLTNAIHVLRDGAEAMEYFFGNAESGPKSCPRCVLLDLNLPKVHGLEILERLKSDSRTKALPVIVLTSSRETPDLQRAYALGANSYLCKPIEFSAFVETVRQIGLYWLLLNQAPD